MDRRADTLVIGGGAVGVCAAYYLHQRGRDVTLIEKGAVCSGSSYGNAGLIVPNHCVPLAEPGVIARGLRWLLSPDSPFYIKPRLNADLLSWLWTFCRHCTESHVQRSMPLIRDLSLASLELFETLSRETRLNLGLQQRGGLMLFKSLEGMHAGIDEARRVRDVGIRAQELTAKACEDLLPNVRLKVVGGVLYPQNGHLDPARFVRSLASHLEDQGVHFSPETEVLELVTRKGRITGVVTTRGTCEAEEVILCGGAWSPGIVGGLGLSLPIQAAKGYSITVDGPAGSPEIPLMLTESKVAVTPLDNRLRFAGTLELAGMDFSINRKRVQAILDAVPVYLPDLEARRLEILEIWRGLRPCTPDGLPFLGRPGHISNLIVAAGHAMIGISLAPITGRLVADLATGTGETDIDLSLLAVDRFG